MCTNRARRANRSFAATWLDLLHVYVVVGRITSQISQLACDQDELFPALLSGVFGTRLPPGTWATALVTAVSDGPGDTGKRGKMGTTPEITTTLVK
jgi:hypothetical protein